MTTDHDAGLGARAMESTLKAVGEVASHIKEGTVNEGETGFRHLSRIYKAIEQAALSSPWAKDPYVVMRREKGSSKDNNLPTRRALHLLRKVDPSLHELALDLEKMSDSLWLKERKCTRCGLLYEPAPDADSGLCILCVMEVKRA